MVYLQLESIRKCVKLSSLRKTLLTLPRTISDSYERIIQNIESADHLQDAVQALQWLCFSIRPLSLQEIVEILAIHYGEEGGFSPDERLPDSRDIVVVCSGLIDCSTDKHPYLSPGDSSYERILGGDGIELQSIIRVQLAHFSVKEYLLSDSCAFRSEFKAETCHVAMAEGCLYYLHYLCQQGPLKKRH